LATPSIPPPSPFSNDPSVRFRAKRPSIVTYDLSKKEASRMRKWEKTAWPTLDDDEEWAKTQFYNAEIKE